MEFYKNFASIANKQQQHLFYGVSKKCATSFSTPLQNKTIAICIRIFFSVNNFFCTLWSISGKRTFCVASVGTKKISATKRRLFFFAKIILQSFFTWVQKWKKKYKTQTIQTFYSLRIPKSFRKVLLRTISRDAKVICFEFFKAFNGCKVKKRRRKKRQGFRSFR